MEERVDNVTPLAGAGSGGGDSVFANRKNPFWGEIPVVIEFRDMLCGSKPMSAQVYIDHLKRKTGIDDMIELRRLFLIDFKEAGAFEEGDDPSEMAASLTETEFYDLVERATKKYETKALTGFFSDDQGLYLENYQLKGAIKEAVAICYPYRKGKPKGTWGPTKKSPRDYAAERIELEPRKIYLKRRGEVIQERDGIREITGRVSGAQGKRQVVSRYEYVTTPRIEFTIFIPNDPVVSDEFDDETWANIWENIEKGGIGGSRNSGMGRCAVTRFGNLGA